MKDIENSKKEAPMLGLTGMGGGVGSLMWHHAAGLIQGGLWVWGSGGFGQTMQTNKIGRSSPIQVGTDSNWAYLPDTGVSDGYYSIAGKADGTLWTAGSPKEDGSGANRGMTGMNNATQYSSPIQIGSDATWTGAM